MDNIALVRYLLSIGDWMVKLDLKDAYLTVPIHIDYQRFLQFVCKGFSITSLWHYWNLLFIRFQF